MSTYRNIVAMLAGLTAVLGVVMLVIALSGGGGGTGILIGLLFLAAGLGRLYLLRKRR